MKEKQKKQPQEPKEDRLAQMTETLKRVQADFENYRKQVEKRMEDLRKTATKQLLVELLPLVDHFNLAMLHTSNHKEFRQGIELIHQQLSAVLEKQGVHQIPTENMKLDVEKHEAVEKVNSKEPENTIIKEVQRGYMLRDKVLRPAKVKISTGKEEKP